MGNLFDQSCPEGELGDIGEERESDDKEKREGRKDLKDKAKSRHEKCNRKGGYCCNENIAKKIAGNMQGGEP